MSKAIEGAALLGGALAMGVSAFLDPALVASPLFDKAMATLALQGIAMEAGAIAEALTANRGMNITTRQAAAARQIVYGQQRVGGVMIYNSTTGSSHDQMNFIIVLAAHEIDSIQNVYLDGRQVHFQGSGDGWSVRNGVGFGGIADSNSYTGPNGVQYNFGGTGHSGVYFEARYGDQVSGDVMGSLTANDPNWAATADGNPWVGGCAYVYCKIEYNTNLFPSLPEIRFTVNGKNNVFDPRTGTVGFTSNAALIAADILTDPTFGLGDNSVNQAQLVAAANVCDEQVELAAVAGSTEARYACNTHYDTSVSPGDALVPVLQSMGGRISRIGGEWFIWPAYWQGPSFTFDENSLTSTPIWKPTRKKRDLFNRVNGTYTAPTFPYNIAGNLYDKNGFYNGEAQNNFPFAFQPTNYPQYAVDPLHGYATDEYLNQDSGVTGSWSSATTYAEGVVVSYGVGVFVSISAGNVDNVPVGDDADPYWQVAGRELPKELALQAVLSVVQAQRLAKIMLLRNRYQGTGNFEMMSAAFRMQPTDVMQFTFPVLGWTEKTLEIVGVAPPVPQEDENGALKLVCGITLGETDPSVYEWSTSEELTVYDVPSTPTQNTYDPAPPTGMTLTSGAGTAIVQPDGTVLPRIEVQWDTPADILTKQIQIQYQAVGAVAWLSAPSVDVSLNLGFISGVVAGQQYDVRIRSARANGAISDWEEIDGYTVSITLSVVTQLAIAQTSLTGMSFNDGTAEIVVSPFTAVIGSLSVSVLPAGAFTITGLNQSQLYFVYYVDPTFAGGAVTPIATQNQADYLNKVGYFFVGSLVTPYGGSGGVSGSRWSPSTYTDIGSQTTSSPAAAYDGDISTTATVAASSIFLESSARSTRGSCSWSGFPAVTLSDDATLTVIAAVSSSGLAGHVSITAAGGVTGTLLSESATTVAQATYTLSVPSGTDISTISVSATAVPGTATSGSSNSSVAVAIAEIYIQQ